jgi:2-polyprenyl-3-methyl-5-hydroxy-6-metoxy-1,4-benzoquinol methylase
MNGPGRVCPCCDARVSQLFDATAYLRCDVCGALLSTAPEASYEQDYYYHKPELEKRESRRGPLLFRFFEQVQARLPRALRPSFTNTDLLELGCSRGYFVEACLGHGITARGVDISPHAIASAHARGLGSRCSRVDVLAQGAPAALGRADLVVAWELLEHFDDPTAFLGAVYGALRPGGWFIGSTPNGGSSWLRLLGGAWHGCEIPQYHRVYYNPGALERAFARRGFGPVVTASCVDWRDSFLIKATATAIARRALGQSGMVVRASVAAAIAVPEKVCEFLSGRVPGLEGDTLLFAARRVG